MHSNPRVFGEPVADFHLFVSGVVVHHQAQFLIGVCAGDMFEEGEEFLVAVARFADPGDLAGRDVQGGGTRSNQPSLDRSTHGSTLPTPGHPGAAPETGQQRTRRREGHVAVLPWIKSTGVLRV
jgi:hypothetical protein